MTHHDRHRWRAVAAAATALVLGAASCASAQPEPDGAATQPTPTAAATAAVSTTSTTATTETGAVEVEMPDVIGLPQGFARLTVRDAGITGPISELRGDEPVPGADPGEIIAQDPEPGELVDPNTDVTLHTAPEPDDTAEVVKPDVDDTPDGDTVEDDVEPQATVDSGDPDPVLAAIATPGWMEANGAVAVDDTGLMWVPWAPFDDDAHERLVAERERWDSTMPPYTPAVRRAIANEQPIAREKADKPGSWHPVIDREQVDIHLREHTTGVSEEIQVCPNRLGENSALSSRLSTELVAPGGLQIHAVADVINPMGALLAFSPGEPMSIAGLRYLADQGFVPGDWSAAALEVLVRRAAIAAMIEELIPKAAMSTAPDSLWEACMDAASTASRSNRRSGSWGITLQTLWSRGLRLQFEARPPDQVWIETVEAGARVGAIMCRPAETVHLVDASTGVRVGVFEQRTEAARALELSWGGDRFRAHKFASLEGPCEPGSDAWNAAIAQLGEWADEGAATVDLSRWWSLGVRQAWLRVGQWVTVPQEIAWEAHRSAGLDGRLWCSVGPPIRDPFDAEEIRENVRPHCTEEQRSRMLDEVASAPAYTRQMSGFDMPLGTPWADRNKFPLRSKADMLGCDPTPEEIASDLRVRPIEPTLKRPWPPGLLPGSSANGWPLPATACPGVEWPSFDDARFWWPADRAPVGDAGQRKGLGVK